jgi:hypothetical protein
MSVLEKWSGEHPDARDHLLNIVTVMVRLICFSLTTYGF